MSWKNIVSAGLLCVLASPAFAAPAVTITNAGLNAQGNWVWNVTVSNSSPVPTGSSPLAAELGFKETASTLISATNLSTGAGDDFDTVNPGKAIFGWETPGTGTNNNPEGIQTNCASGCTVNVGANNPNSIFSALGSIDFNTVGPHDYIQIITKGPTGSIGAPAVATRKTSIQMLGAYTGMGRIAEATTTTTAATNYDTFAGQQFIVATLGDTNLTGGVDLTDFNKVLEKFGIGVTWQDGNFDGNGTGTTDLTDFNTVLAAFGQASGVQGSGPGPGAGAGLGAGSSVPEPTSIVLFLLGSAAVVAKRRRK
jgi:hypothetical protein